jgi:glutamate racemase
MGFFVALCTPIGYTLRVMKSEKKLGPIGVFDSGIGGLTVLAALRHLMPNDSFVYLGDTARVPYGTKSAETVVRYSRECADFLTEKGVRAIVVACNTASACALPDLASRYDVPILGVVDPGADAAIASTRGDVVGVIGTAGTIGSNAYGNALKARRPSIRVVSRACPLLVPLIEEGWITDDVAKMVVSKYLGDMKSEGIDTLILGCTHYPLLSKVIADELGSGVRLVDSADTTALALRDLLAGSDSLSEADQGTGSCRIYVTDMPARFEVIGRRFLGDEPPPVTRVDL